MTTDPFYRNQTPTNIDTQTIITQQKEIEENFQKLKTLFADPNINSDQKQQIKQKLLELKDIYTENKKILANSQIGGTNINTQNTAPTNENNQKQTNIETTKTEQQVHVNKINAVEDPSKRSGFTMKKLFIGCGIIFLLLIGGVAFLFYYMLNHPAELKNIGMAPENVKQLLQTFTVVFFGGITLLGFTFFVVNVYRIFNSKKKNKLAYIGGVLFSILLLGGGIFGGFSIIQKVNTISIDKILNNSNLVRPYLLIKNKPEYIGDKKNTIIAPAQITFGLNTSLFIKQIAPKIPGKITSVSLSCGNGQEIQKNPQNEWFNGTCFYRTAQSEGYGLTINISYISQSTSEQLTQSFKLGKFPVISNIDIFNQKGVLLNEGGEKEIIGGIAGDTLTFDAGKTFKTLGLKEYEISWDFDGDGNVDRENETKATFRYTKAGVYYVGIRFPKMNTTLYTFPIRIEQSDVPIGEILQNDLGKNTYNFEVQFFEQTKPITEYMYQVINKQGKIIKNQEKNTNTFTYTFEKGGTYRIKALFITQDNKQGSILSENIIIDDTNANFITNISSKFVDQEKFQEIKEVQGENNTSSIKIKEIPSVVKIQLNRSELENKGYTISANYDEKPLIFIDNFFTVNIENTGDHTISLFAINKDKNKRIEKKINILVEREGIVGKLNISPDTVGTSPFVVKFDASTSQINDPDDEIVYFTWDFGDGERYIKRNTSESIVEHIYYYDEKNNNGEFHPLLHIKTKKGKKYDIGEGTIILVKQPLTKIDISIDSHPAQIAKKEDIVEFSLQLDGLPKKIYWDFGNNENTECSGRTCVETKKIYHETGEYKIKVKVEYENRIPLEGSITLVVK